MASPADTAGGRRRRRHAETPPAWLAELPLTPGPPWVAMGVRGIAEEGWLVFDDDEANQLAEKAAAPVDDVFLAEAGTEDAGRETLDLVVDWIEAHGRGRAVDTPARATGSDDDGVPDERHPLLRAALLVQEDLCLMAERGGAWCLVAGAVHFPSHWRLRDKLGLPLADVHGPVRHYAEELEQRADRFFDRLATGRIVVRRNLSIHDHEELFRTDPPETYEDFDGDFDRLWLRSERQTLRRLPVTGAILFTIKTQQCPLPLVRAVPGVAAGLAAKLAAIRAEGEAAGVPVHAPAGIATWLTAGGAT